MTILGNTITYGQLIPSYAKYQDLILPILKNVGGPPATCAGGGVAGEGVTAAAKSGENIVKMMTERNYTYKMDHGFSFAQNPSAGAAHQTAGYTYNEPSKIATVSTSAPWMDCSGFVSWVYHDVGVMTGLYSSWGFHDKEMKLAPGYEAVGPFPINISEMQPGDILWRKGHVGLYIGGGMQLDWGCVRPWGTKNPHKVEGAGYTHYIRIQNTNQSNAAPQLGAPNSSTVAANTQQPAQQQSTT